MENNLKLFRELSGVTAKELATLLNVTTHTYIAFEQGKMSIPKVIEVMVSKIYSIPTDNIYLNVDKILLANLKKISQMAPLSQRDRWELMINNLFGQKISITYHTVSKLKEEILSTLVFGESGSKQEGTE